MKRLFAVLSIFLFMPSLSIAQPTNQGRCIPSVKVGEMLEKMSDGPNKMLPVFQGKLENGKQRMSVWSNGKNWIAVMDQAPMKAENGQDIPAISCFMSAGKGIEMTMPACTLLNHDCI